MKYLGLDIGEKVVGVAASDSGIVASPLPALKMNSSFMGSLGKVIEQEQAEMVVFGIPSYNNGTENGLAGDIRSLAEGVRHEFDVEVDFVDEYGTTKQAEKILKSSGVDGREIAKYDDSVAAALILERYFEENRRNNTILK